MSYTIAARALVACVVVLFALPSPVHAQMNERLCDPELEDCRAPLLNLINNERQGIDVAFWYMADARYATALINRFKAGVPVRVLMDDRSVASHSNGAFVFQYLKDAGIPMRKKNGGGILHWKMMLFDGQNIVEFSKANYSAEEFVPEQDINSWSDEAIYFSSNSALTNTFRTKFDDQWVSSGFVNYGNVGTPTRRYPVFPLVGWMNFPPSQNFATRTANRINLETTQIDVLVFRATDATEPNALIAAKQRGVRVRVMSDPTEYRNPDKHEHAQSMDRMYMAGIELKHRKHNGLMHEASVVLHGLGEVIFGSSNWSPQSANQQTEHNLFYKPSLNIVLDSGETFYAWFRDQFERKWNNTTAFVPFVPLPPTNPVYSAPANGAGGVSTNPTLRWDGGAWGVMYDIMLGTSSTNLAPVAQNVLIGSGQAGVIETYTLQNLAPGTQYYWRIDSKTYANMVNHGPIWTFTTAGSSGGTTASNVVLYAGKATTRSGNWETVADSSAAGGVRMHEPNLGVPKVGTPSASPSNYFEMSFNAQAGIAYQLWLRGRADNNNYANDSVWVQFTNSANSSGTAMWRIGSTSGTYVSVENCSGCGVQGWGWNDNGYGTGVAGTPVYFTTTGVQTIRIQQREDGISIDQIVLSPSTYLTSAPGLAKNDTTILAESGGATGGSTAGINEVVLHASTATNVVGAKWARVSDSTAADGIRLHNPNAGAAKVTTALASPSSYFETTFHADSGKAYHLWLRMKADDDSWANDSVWVQFSGSATASGGAAWRIGTTSALAVSLEEGKGAGVKGWGWNDNSYGGSGAPVYFSASGPQIVRVQARDDGASVDQIVLSAVKYVNTRPGALKNDTTILAEAN